MKIIVIDHRLAEPMNGNPAVEHLPDSALLTHAKPFFIPDSEMPWSFRIYAAFRISRLGKSIALRFAHRYYDAATIAVRPVTDGIPPGMLAGMDGAWITGEWTDPADIAGEISGPTGPIAGIPPLTEMIDEAIHRVSHFSTLKMGDIIAPVSIGPDIPSPGIGGHLPISVGTKAILNVRIK